MAGRPQRLDEHQDDGEDQERAGKEPIYRDGKSPLHGTRRTPRAMPCRMSAAIRVSQTIGERTVTPAS